MSGEIIEQSEKAVSVDQSISTADSPIQAIAKMAMSGVGTEIVEQMKGLVEWEDARKAKAEFNAAFSLAKASFKKAKKSGKHATFGAYSLLEDLDDATREALSANNLSWRHIPKTIDNDTLSITCVLAHKSGYAEEAELTASTKGMSNNATNSLQAVGIVNTYLKRMTLGDLVGIVSDSEFDNDGSSVKTKEPPKITAEQAANLQCLLDEVGKNKEDFLKWAKADSLESVLARQYSHCVKTLEGLRK